jgi:cobalt-zinc-cadmium efflux system outer membrane protein
MITPPEMLGQFPPAEIQARAELLATMNADPGIKRVQAVGNDLLPLPGVPAPTLLSPNLATMNLGSQSIGLEQALTGALSGNPDLIALRQNAPATAEAVEVARLFPTALNPTLWVNPRPGVWERNVGRSGYHGVRGYFNISVRQPIELGHQTTHRMHIAAAAYDQARWNIQQAEMMTIVQTYRSFQTAAYRREKLRLAEDLVRFNEKLVASLKKGLENNTVKADDVALSEVEREAVAQQVELARQDYATALADLQNQIGRPETAGVVEPLGEFILPPFIQEAQDEALVQLALSSRPEIAAARAAARGTCAAVALSKGDQLPTMLVGPEYTRDEFGNHFAGFIAAMPLPVLNNGSALVRQREAEHRRALIAVQQIEQRTVTQVKSATAKWNAANRLVTRTNGSTETLKSGVNRLEKLFEESQTDISRLLQARQRLIQLENARLDAIWQATQAQADLLMATGAPTLIGTLPAGG